MSQVVIGDILPYTQAIAILNQTVFGTNWTANYESDVVVYVTPSGDDADDVTQILSYPSQYSVAFIGSQQDVQVTLVTPSAAGDRVTITRQTPADRENLYTNTNFVPSMLNNDFGILTLVDQQAELVDQKIGPRYNYSAVIVDVVDTILPILGANQGWVKNNGNTAIIPYTFPSGGLAPADATYVTLSDETAVLPNSAQLLGTANQITLSNATISIASNPIIPGSAGMGIPQGTTGQRVVPLSGISFRYNTDSQRLEFWDGATWTQIADSTDFSALPTGFVTVTTGSGALNSRLFVPTANQIDITNTDGSGNPAFSLSATLNFPGTFTAQGTTAINAIINDPTMAGATTSNISTSAALKTYIDSLVTGLHIQGSCVAGSTVALTVTYDNGASGVGATLTNAGVQAALSLDGVSPSVGERVLIKNQASSLQNGIYTVTDVGSGATNWVLTRATDFDSPAEIQPGDLVVLTGGSTQAQSSWLQTATVAAVGTDPITFVQFTASLPVNVASGGTGVTSFTPYGLIAGGLTSTGSLQQVAIGAAGTILRSGGVAALPSFSTATFASTYGASELLYSNGANTVQGLTTANSSVLVTSAGGVPSLSTTLPSGLTIPGYALSGANADITSMTGLTGTLQAPTGITSSAGANMFGFNYTASAVNYLRFTNNVTGSPPDITATGTDTDVGMILITKGVGAFTFTVDAGARNILVLSPTASAVNYIAMLNNTTGSAPAIAAVGSDTNITLELTGKGTGGVYLVGTGTNDNAVTRQVGENVSATVTQASPVSITTNTQTNVTSISLTAGDWDVTGNIWFEFSTQVGNGMYAASSTTSATLPGGAENWAAEYRNGANAFQVSMVIPTTRYSLSATTTVYLVAQCLFAGGTGAVSGNIKARRVR